MKIIDLKCAIMGGSPVVRIKTDEGIDGYSQAEWHKPFLKSHVLFYKDLILGQDPTNVEQIMLRIRRMGGFKPWGAAVSIIEVALWDLAGKASGLPIYKLLGGKVRDKVRVYNGGVRFPMAGYELQHYAEDMQKMLAAPEQFSIVKQGVAFHGDMMNEVPNFFYGERQPVGRHPNRGALTPKGFRHLIACIEAMKEVTGDAVGLALDCGPGFIPSDALKLAKAVEALDLLWLEDMITGDYTPYVMADLYREVTAHSSTPTHTGEQIYLRQNFRELIERKAVRVLGPDPLDVGGLAELKWITEYADLHGILMAPHGVADGLFGLAALLQVCATLPSNFIAFEYPVAQPEWWYDIVEGLPDPIVEKGFIQVWDRPGLGLSFRTELAKKYLDAADRNFFD